MSPVSTPLEDAVHHTPSQCSVSTAPLSPPIKVGRVLASNQNTRAATKYIELWDESSGSTLHFLGFVVGPVGHRSSPSLYVFFDEMVVNTHLKSSTLVALLELAELKSIACERVVLCLDTHGESQEQLAEQIKALGFVGFAAVAELEETSTLSDDERHMLSPTSTRRYIFMEIEV